MYGNEAHSTVQCRGDRTVEKWLPAHKKNAVRQMLDIVSVQMWMLMYS